VGVYDAQAIGADEADVVLAGNLDQFQFPLQPLAAGLPEPGADDDGGRHALLSTLAQRLRHQWVGDDDDRQVHRPGDVQDGGVGLQPQNLLRLGVDRVEGAGESAVLQIRQHRVPQFLRVPGCPDDGDGGGTEEEV